MKTASFFSGVGGIELGFDGFNIVYANEIDKNAVQTYESNFSINVDHRDIALVNEKQLPDFEVLLGGFPCQAFSVAGHQLGFNDPRGNIFFDLLRIIHFKRPKIIFLENVKNLVSHNRGQTFSEILNRLKRLGYCVKHKVLNAMEYANIPQNRERIYIVAFQEQREFEKFSFPDPIPLTSTIEDIVDVNLKVDDKYYYNSNFKHWDLIQKDIKQFNTLYQWRRQYVRENKSKVCPTLTANMGTGGHNVPLVLTKHGIRKLTPKECFLFQGFPIDFVLPKIADSHLYKQAGNSVCVEVVRRISKKIRESV